MKKKQVNLHRHGKKWTSKEEAMLRELYPNLFTHELQERFGRTLIALHTKAESMGIRKSWRQQEDQTCKGKPWSKKDIEKLKRLYPVTPTLELLAHFPKRSIESLRGQARKLGLRKNYITQERSHARLFAKQRIWSAEDIKKLRKLWRQGYNKSEISEILGKSFNSVLSQIFKQIKYFGLEKRNERRDWSEEEIDYLIEHYETTPVLELSIALGREKYSIHQKAQKLKLSSEIVRRWTEQETELIKKYYYKWSVEKIAEKLDRSVISVKGKAQYLGLLKKRAHWTTEEINFLKKYYSKLTQAEIAEILDKTISSVYWRARQLDLLSSPPKKK